MRGGGYQRVGVVGVGDRAGLIVWVAVPACEHPWVCEAHMYALFCSNACGLRCLVGWLVLPDGFVVGIMIMAPPTCLHFPLSL
jgi:hypothetical protein